MKVRNPLSFFIPKETAGNSQRYDYTEKATNRLFTVLTFMASLKRKYFHEATMLKSLFYALHLIYKTS